MSFLTAARVRAHREINGEYRLLDFYSPLIARRAVPGQFVHVRCSGGLDPLLRRPISIHAVNLEEGTVRLLYRIVGRGTSTLACRQVGDEIDVLGPLGRGFTFPSSRAKIVLVAGGIGVAPLFFLLQRLAGQGHSIYFLFGARTKADLVALDQIDRYGCNLQLATEDGSTGHRGLVTDLLVECLSGADFVYACGPRPMLRRVAQILSEHGIPGEVSLEERMGCGVGACLSCACRTVSGMARVCTEGPVFPVGEVVWDE